MEKLTDEDRRDDDRRRHTTTHASSLSSLRLWCFGFVNRHSSVSVQLGK